MTAKIRQPRGPPEAAAGDRPDASVFPWSELVGTADESLFGHHEASMQRWSHRSYAPN